MTGNGSGRPGPDGSGTQTDPEAVEIRAGKSGVDVLIAGGGVIGSSIAYFLSAQAEAGGLRIKVVERDSTYATSSTALSVGGIRQQFSTSENIQLSAFSARFLRDAPELLKVGDEEPDLGFREKGYLFLATDDGLPVLQRNLELQTRLGTRVKLLSPRDLKDRLPWLQVADLAAGSWGLEGEGWLDPYSLLQALRKKAQDQGVAYLEDEVVGVERTGGRVQAISLRDRGRVPVGALINATGPWAASLARMAGIGDFPVHPRKRFVYRVQAPDELPGCPMVIDPSGVYFRPEGDGFLCGVSPSPAKDRDARDLTMEYDLFHEVVWPTLARRVPLLDTLRLGSSWAGLYAYNTLDQNAILGPHPQVPNLYFANGFSGHGLQHSPGIGRALAELVLYGEYKTLDLTRFSLERFAEGNLIREENVV